MFPEGGLSLTGALAAPKLGLLKYIVDGHDPKGRDVVFVPVALNYDRVLEDKILTSAAKAQERRFRAGLGVVAYRMLRQLWLWMTGRYHRFGYAAVSFGRPVSLTKFTGGKVGDITKPLAQDLMRRIGEIVPVLPVPLVAWLLSEHGTMSQSALTQKMEQLIEQMPLAHIHMPRHDWDYAAEVGLRQLVERGVVSSEAGHFSPVEGERDLLNFYANSIRHLVPCADASGISAPAK